MTLLSQNDTTDYAEPECGTPSSAIPIDLKHLYQYTLGDRNLERDLLSLFRDQAKIYLTKMGPDCDAQNWADTAHTLKGSAKSVGAWQIAQLAETAEAMATVDYRQRKDMIHKLELAIMQAKRFIDCRLLDCAS